MAHPLARRFLPPFVLFVLFYTTFRHARITPWQSPRHPHYLDDSHEPLHVPINRPFANRSRPGTHLPRPDNAPSSNTESKPVELEVSIEDMNTVDESAPVLLDVSHNSQKPIPPALLQLSKCPRPANRFTNHIRLPNLLYNISMSPRTATVKEERRFWNPTIFALPYWAKNRYIIVSMVAPNGEAQRRNVLCEANICRPKSAAQALAHERSCSEDDLELLGPNGGLRCVTAPIEVNVPPTPAAKCEGLESVFADIPGFHDPRIFYSGRGEPILMVSSQ